MARKSLLKNQGLYNKANEHDACGVGFVTNIHGKKSHDIIEQGLTILDNLTHRGATGYDQKLGDGAGLLSQVPHNFFADECKELNIFLPDFGHYGIGMLFLPQNIKARNQCEQIIERITTEEGQNVCLLYTSPSPRDRQKSRMPSSA